MAHDKLTVILEFKGTQGDGLHIRPLIEVRVLEIEEVEEIVTSIDDGLDVAKSIIWDNWVESLPETELDI